MRKYQFWFLMCALSVVNGWFFYRTSLRAMERGAEGVDNQAALLFIPLLWIMAVFVLLLINLYTLIQGKHIRRSTRISLVTLFRPAGLSRAERLERGVFFIVTGLLMLFGYALFAGEGLWAVAYALSGGGLLLCLYAWQTSGRKKFCR